MSWAIQFRSYPSWRCRAVIPGVKPFGITGEETGTQVLSHSPPSKRQQCFEPDDTDSNCESDQGFNLESYYDSATEDRTAEDVQKFISVAFKRCLSHRKRKELAREFPKPQAAKAPETDSLLADFLGKRYPEQDKQLSRIQTSILAACPPLTDLWSSYAIRGYQERKMSLIPVEEVLKVIRASVALYWELLQLCFPAEKENNHRSCTSRQG